MVTLARGVMHAHETERQPTGRLVCRRCCQVVADVRETCPKSDLGEALMLAYRLRRGRVAPLPGMVLRRIGRRGPRRAAR